MSQGGRGSVDFVVTGPKKAMAWVTEPAGRGGAMCRASRGALACSARGRAPRSLPVSHEDQDGGQAKPRHTAVEEVNGH